MLAMQMLRLAWTVDLGELPQAHTEHLPLSQQQILAE